MKKYFKVWWIFAGNSFQSQMIVRWSAALFVAAKILRFSTFSFFIVILLSRTNALAGYNLDQTILFFLTFNLIDVLSQFFFRDVYRFRPAVVSGNFDFYLIKPINPLFRSLASGPDLFDFLTLIPLIIAIGYFINKLNLLDFYHLTFYLLLVAGGFLISLAFHIFVLSLAILTTEIDHAIMLYRDLTGLGRMPIDIYREPIRSFLTFVIPVGMMISFPVKALLGLLDWQTGVYTICFAGVLVFMSIQTWYYALKKYASASS